MSIYSKMAEFKYIFKICLIFVVFQPKCIAANNQIVKRHEDLASLNNTVAVVDQLSEVAVKLVEAIAASADDKVDMNSISDFVLTLSKATIQLMNPQMLQMDEIMSEVNKANDLAATETEALRTQVKILEATLNKTDDKIKVLNQRVNVLEANLQKFMSEIDSKQKIGFTASSTSSQQLYAGTYIKFQRIHVNHGNNYDPSVGIFTCPVTGLYVMSVTITAYSTKHVNAYLVLNDAPELHLYSYGSTNHNYNSVSETGLVKCDAGSKMWVKSNGNGHAYGGRYTMFTGFLYEAM